MEKLWPYKISVVMPIYNTTEYMEEAIQSIVKQTLGIKHIQLILVNNGADQKAHNICTKYKDEFSQNVEYIKFDHNKGVSAARNAGKEFIRGKYVNFLDSDDRWNLDAYEIMYDYFERNYDTIDFVSARIKYFEGKTDWHGLDWKFTANEETVDLNMTPEKIQLNVGASLIKSEILDSYSFDESVRHAEDAKFLAEIVLKKLKYGLLKNAIFNYRVRSEGNSVLQNVHTSKDWYFGTPQKVYLYLMSLSKQLYGLVIPYIQWLVMYELQWRMPVPFPESFEEKQKYEYIEIVKRLLSMIDDEIILQQRCLWDEYKIYALCMKYNTVPALYQDTMKIAIGNCFVNTMKKITYIEEIWQDSDMIRISGFIRYCVPLVDLDMKVTVNGCYRVAVELFNLDDASQVYSFGEKITKGKRFRFHLNSEGGAINFVLCINNAEITQIPYVFRSAKTNVRYCINSKGMMVNA